MILAPMDQTEILETIDYCYRMKQYTIQIVLVDGKTVSGKIPCQVYTYTNKTGSRSVSSSKERCFLDNALIIYYGKVFHEHSIYIPLDSIAGISIIDYEEEEIVLDSESRILPATNMSINDYMFEDLFSYASKKHLKIKPHLYLYSLRVSKPFAWGDLSYKADVALYADWSYLENTSGGINALGAGVGIVSLSSGFTKSLWSQFRNKVKQKSIEICKISNESEIVVQGCITFIEYYPDFPVLRSAIDMVEMEGGRWLPAIISNKRINNISDINNCKWALLYLRDDGLMFPQKAWERISDPINVFCEVVHTSVITEFGTTPFYLKARCAAYIKST